MPNQPKQQQKTSPAFKPGSRILRLGPMVWAKMTYMGRLIVDTPYWGWIIFFQITSGLASFIGFPILIPLLEMMQTSSVSPDASGYLKWVILPLQYLGIELNFNTILFIAGLLIIFGQMLVILSSLTAGFAREKLRQSYARQLFEKYAQVDWLWLTNKHSGGMYYAVVTETQMACDAHLNAQRVFINAFQVFTFFLIALRLSVGVTLLAGCLYFVLAVLNIWNSSYIFRLAERFNQTFKKISVQLTGFQQNKKFFKVSLLNSHMVHGLSEKIDELCGYMKRQYVRMEFQRAWSMVVPLILLMLMIFFHERLNLDYVSLMLILFIFVKMAPQFVALCTLYNVMNSCIPVHQSLQRHLQALDQHREMTGTVPFDEQMPIRFQDVHFHYPNSHPVLKGINLVIEPRRTVALVGGSGVGKSTTLDLILGLLKPDQGTIFYGDIPHTELDIHTLRQKVAYVSQQPSLLEGTLRENLIIGKPSASEEEIKNICAKVHLDNLIEQLPDKYETLIGENGIKLSGGQRQRLVLGRSLFLNPKILILDEATSELDLESEAMIQATLAKLKEELTVIIVAHRLATVKLADTIYVVEGGRVCESGTYQQLLEQKGRLHFFDSLQR